MKKIISFLILSLFFLPIPALALSENNVTADYKFVDFDDLKSQKKMAIPVHFKVTSSADDLSEIKMIKLSVKDTCSGGGDLHLQQGDFRPASDDSQDGMIEGELIYEAQYIEGASGNSCTGKHDIRIYLCRTTNKECMFVSNVADRILKKDISGIIEIASEPPSDDNPPVGDGSGSNNGGGLVSLLPGEGRYHSIWDVLVVVVQLLLSLAGVVAVGAIIVGGYQYITSSGIPDRVEVAKATITYAIIGLVLIVTAYAIIRFLLPAVGVSREVIWF